MASDRDWWFPDRRLSGGNSPKAAVEITVIAQQLSEQIGDLAVAALPERISTFGLGTSVRPHLNEQTSRR